MDIKVRRAVADDSVSITDINISSWQQTYKNIFPEYFLKSLDDLREDTINKNKNKIDEYLVAEVDNQVVGFIRVGKNKKGYSEEYAEVYALYVDNDFKSKGIGTKLLKSAFKILKNEFKYCLISTLKENKANNFYLKMHGQKIDEIVFSLKGNEYIENLYLYIL